MNHIRDSKIKHSEETNWYVITGGPSTGKTTTNDLLQKQGLPYDNRTRKALH